MYGVVLGTYSSASMDGSGNAEQNRIHTRLRENIPRLYVQVHGMEIDLSKYHRTYFG